jgi:hypothetical protein
MIMMDRTDQLRHRAILYAQRQWLSLLPAAVRRTLSSVLNESQLSAVQVAVTLDGITLLQGPPGTGKTKTVVSLISALLLLPPSSTTTAAKATNGNNGNGTHQRPPRILVATPSNAALDELVSRVMSEGLINAAGDVHTHTTHIHSHSSRGGGGKEKKIASSSGSLLWSGRIVRLGQPEKVRGDVAEQVSIDTLVDTFVHNNCMIYIASFLPSSLRLPFFRVHTS